MLPWFAGIFKPILFWDVGMQMFHPIKHWSSRWTGQPPCHCSPTRWPFPYVDGEIRLEFQLLGGEKSRLRPPKETNRQIATAPIAVGLYYSQPKKKESDFLFPAELFFFSRVISLYAHFKMYGCVCVCFKIMYLKYLQIHQLEQLSTLLISSGLGGFALPFWNVQWWRPSLRIYARQRQKTQLHPGPDLKDLFF